MTRYITLVFECESNQHLDDVRSLAGAKQCRAWSLDHELLRLDLIRQAIGDRDFDKAGEYLEMDDVTTKRHELRCQIHVTTSVN